VQSGECRIEDGQRPPQQNGESKKQAEHASRYGLRFTF